MPAKIGDPVSASLRLSLSGNDISGDLDKRLAHSSSQVLNSSVEYEESESYNASVLDNLKHKYVWIDVDKPVLNGYSPNQRVLENPVDREMRPEPDSVLPTPKVILFPAERVHLGWRGNYPVGAGMINVGNTCYLNSTLQALYHIPALVNWLHSDSDHMSKCHIANGSIQAECIICAMSKTLKASQNKSAGIIKPYLIYNKLKLICKHMVHGQQEDAHEFMRYLIESMEESYLVRFKGEKLDNYSKETTPLNQIFGGYMRTEVNCLQCRGVSTTFQHFQDLLLDIRRASTLDDALALYFHRERLDGDDAYRCERCHKKVDATKKFSIEKPPFVLCIQLKRFSMVGGKLNKHVSFTQHLDMTRFLCPQSAYRGSQPLTYRLVSMVTHMGTSVHCGHYTAIAQTSSGHFYQFDDSSVRPMSLNAALETNAYIIIYELERTDSRICQNHMPGPKPATITSGTSTPILASNGQKCSNGRPFIGPLLPLGHKPGPSILPPPPSLKLHSGAPSNHKAGPVIIPAVHKPVGLPSPKERDRTTFGLQPRLVMHIKNGKVCSPSTQETKHSSSLVPYDSEDSSESDTEKIEKTEKKPDMPSLEPSSEGKSPTPNKQNLPLVKRPELFPARSKSPSAGSPFLHKSGELSPSNKPVVSHEMHSKTPPPRSTDTSQMQKTVKPSVTNLDISTACRNKDSDHSLSMSLKGTAECSKSKKPEGGVNGVISKKLLDSDPCLELVSTSVVDEQTDGVQTLQVNTKLPGTGNGKPSSGSWQITDISLHSPSCHSGSSSTSVASSTTPWSVSDVKISPKKASRTALDTVGNSNSTSVSKQSASLSKYPSDSEIGQFSRSRTTSRAKSIESLTVPSSRLQWDVSPSVPGVHRSRCTGKEESGSMAVRQGNSRCSPDKSSKDRKKIVESKYEPYHNGNHKASPPKGDDSDEYEWVEKTHETLGLDRNNGQINGWCHSGRSDVSNHLMKMSHQGYGSSVNSWNGSRSHMDREVENERRDDRKRSYSKYDEELDMGRVKKMKHNSDFSSNSQKCNRFNEFQKWGPYDPHYHSRGKFFKKNNGRHYNNHHYNGGRFKYSQHRNSYNSNGSNKGNWRR